MQSRAASVLGLTNSLKDTRDQITPLKEQLMSDMTTAGLDKLIVENRAVKLVTRNTRKGVGMKKIIAIITDLTDKETVDKIKDEIDKAKGPPKQKQTLKFIDAED